MVQKSYNLGLFWQIALRIFLFCLVIFLAIYESAFTLNILKNSLGYQTPGIFWGGVLVDGFISIGLTVVFWSGVLFGIFGKKIDYAFISIFIMFALWDFNGTSTVTYGMFWGLVGAAILGNAIGFGLKLLRQKFLPRLKV